MALQGRTDFTNYSLILEGSTFIKDNETLLKDAARTEVLKRGTVMAQVAATKKWVPLTDVTAVDGTNVARGIYLGEDVTAAKLAAADVTGCPILVYGVGCVIDAQLLVLENSLTLDSVVSDDPAGADNGVVNVRRIEDDLLRIGIMTVGTYDVDLLENS